jgi:YD repeat-containing protein
MTTATQTFTYADDGRLIKSVAADGVVTHWFYYPAKGGVGPSVAELFDSTSAEAPILSAPAVADGAPRLLMAEFQYQPFEAGRAPLNLTLYGYPGTKGQGGTNAPDTLLTLEGVDISNLADVEKNEAVSLQFKQITGRDKVLIRYQTTEELPPVASAVIGRTRVTERRYWGAEKAVLITTETREWSAEQGLKVTLASRNTDKEDADVTLSGELRSPYSGRVLRYLQDNQQHRLEYDGLGRTTADTAYADDDTLNDEKGRTDQKLSAVSIQYDDTEGGTRVTTVDLAQPDPRRQRTLYDGLQRPVRSELQRVPGDDVSSANFCVTQNQGQVLDYLTGGLQRSLDQTVVPSDKRVWFWAGDKEQEQAAPANAVSQLLTEQTLASARGIRLIREQIQTQLKTGAVLHSSVERSPQTKGGAPARSRVKTDKSFDWLGRLTELKQTSADSSEAERVFKIMYDDLGRVTRWTAPDNTQVKRSYSGMSDQVTRLSIQEKDGAKEIVLGSQTVEMPARVAGRQVGKRNYQFDYTTEGHALGVRMPDSTRLFSEESSDGS